MKLKSNFKTDLNKEQYLSVLIDSVYGNQLKYYHFERIKDLKEQLHGVDLILTHRDTKKRFFVDEKAQLDYLNDDLPTFAFELSYQKRGYTKKGWLFDTLKKTEFYSLITAIYSDEPNKYTSCKITFVNRVKLLHFLKARNITEGYIQKFIDDPQIAHGKIKIPELNSKTEGYLYLSARNKEEKPLNLILKLDFLIENRLAKRLV